MSQAIHNYEWYDHKFRMSQSKIYEHLDAII